MTPRIYHRGDLHIGEVVLDKDASHHLSKVLRLKLDDQIALFNGDGNNYHATTVSVSNKSFKVSVEKISACDNESPLNITLVQGLSRNDRMDTSLQKSTELGVGTIIPVVCERSRFKLDGDRLEKKLTHWNNVIISACEQSKRCIIPELHKPLPLRDALMQIDGFDTYLLSPEAADGLSEHKPESNNIAIIIGPESGFDIDEIRLLEESGSNTVSFGPRVLRTETAGPAVIAAIQTLWGDMA